METSKSDVFPMRRLMAAILEDAVFCYQRHLFDRSRNGQRLFHDAEDWLLSADDGSDLSLERVCSVLQVDVDYVRRGLRNWRALEMARARSQ